MSRSQVAREPAPTAKQEVILRAALARCANYGYRRTSMEDIATEAGVSRPTLYTHYQNKQAIVHAVSKWLHQEALDRAGVALRQKTPFATRLQEAFEGWSFEFVDLLYGSPHGSELIDTNGRIAAEVSREARAHFQRVLGDAITRAQRAGEIDLSRPRLTASAAAELLVLSAHGLPPGLPDVASYRRRLAELVRLFAAAVQPAGRPRAGRSRHE